MYSIEIVKMYLCLHRYLLNLISSMTKGIHIRQYYTNNPKIKYKYDDCGDNLVYP